MSCRSKCHVLCSSAPVVTPISSLFVRSEYGMSREDRIRDAMDSLSNGVNFLVTFVFALIVLAVSYVLVCTTAHSATRPS